MMHALTAFSLTLVQANRLIDMYILSPMPESLSRVAMNAGVSLGAVKKHSTGTGLPIYCPSIVHIQPRM